MFPFAPHFQSHVVGFEPKNSFEAMLLISKFIPGLEGIIRFAASENTVLEKCRATSRANRSWGFIRAKNSTRESDSTNVGIILQLHASEMLPMSRHISFLRISCTLEPLLWLRPAAVPPLLGYKTHSLAARR